jgi:hypothetical protein
MAVAFQIDSLDKVEEGIRGAYVEADGKFTLDPDRYAEIRSQGLKKKNSELLGKLKSTQTAEDRIRELESEVRQYKLTNPLREMLGKAGVMSDRADVALMIAQKYFRLDDDGRLVVLDEYGDETDISPERFVNVIFKEKRPFLYEASKTGGSGATPSGSRSSGDRGGRTISRAAFDAMGPDQRMAFVQGGGKVNDD